MNMEHIRSDDSLIEWLGKTEPSLRQSDRVDLLAKALAPDSWERSGTVFQSQGHAQYLIKLQQPGWHTPPWRSSQPLSDCFDIHFELDIPILFGGGPVPCRLHFETSPYMSRKKLESLPVDTSAFVKLADAFTASLHRCMRGTTWELCHTSLQKARLDCPLNQATTVTEFSAILVPRIEQIRESISSALADARAVIRCT